MGNSRKMDIDIGSIWLQTEFSRSGCQFSFTFPTGSRISLSLHFREVFERLWHDPKRKVYDPIKNKPIWICLLISDSIVDFALAAFQRSFKQRLWHNRESRTSRRKIHESIEAEQISISLTKKNSIQFKPIALTIPGRESHLPRGLATSPCRRNGAVLPPRWPRSRSSRTTSRSSSPAICENGIVTTATCDRRKIERTSLLKDRLCVKRSPRPVRMKLSMDITAGTFVGGRISSARYCPSCPNANMPSCKIWPRNHCNAHHVLPRTVPGSRRSVCRPRRCASPLSRSWSVSWKFAFLSVLRNACGFGEVPVAGYY